jgi:hypothetical protein
MKFVGQLHSWIKSTEVHKLYFTVNKDHLSRYIPQRWRPMSVSIYVDTHTHTYNAYMYPCTKVYVLYVPLYCTCLHWVTSEIETDSDWLYIRTYVKSHLIYPTLVYLKNSFIQHLFIWKTHLSNTCLSEKLIYPTLVYLKTSFIQHLLI